MKVDLITGFLGAGKTTFIRGYFRYLAKQGERIRMIENEFGPVNVDTRLLSDVTCDVDDLAGVCMCCTGKDQFRRMLLNAAAEGYDRVLVEPSGIYDVDEFFTMMKDSVLQGKCSIGNIITIADPKMDERMTPETRYLMYAQLLASGMIVLSKTQLYDDETLAKVRGQLEAVIGSVDPSQHLDSPVCETSWERLTGEEYAALASCGYHEGRHRRTIFDHRAAYTSIMIGDFCEGRADLETRLDRLFSDPYFGEVLRVKGYIRDLEKNWYAVNCTRQDRSVEPADVKRGLLVVIGQELNEGRLHEAFVPRKTV